MSDEIDFIINYYYVVRFYDHFTTDTNEKRCIGECIGQFIGLDDNYYQFQSFLADIERKNSGRELHNIIKTSIYSVTELNIQGINLWVAEKKE